MKTIYPERESKTLEFKSQAPRNFSNLIKTCIAFANGVGGKIILGVDDESREIIGIDDNLRHRIYDEFPNSIYDATSPSLLVEIYERDISDQSILIIEVPSSIKKPVFLKSEGMSEGVYLRAGSNTRKATKDYVEELIRETKRVHYDEEFVDLPIEALSENHLKEVFNRVDSRRFLAEKILTPTHTQPGKLSPTVAGILFFYEQPELYIPEAMIVCTRFVGTMGRDIIQTEEMTGFLDKQIEQAFQLIRSWLMRDYQLTGARLKAKTIVPEIALREAIINAAIHRTYWIPGAIKIALYDDRLEIFSPGGFPGLIDFNNLGDGTTYLRNPTLARIARKMGLIEKLGTGIRMILEACEKANLKAPEFIEGTDSVKVVFRFLPDGKGKNEMEKLLSYIQACRIVTVNDIVSLLNVSRNTATRKLNQLIDSGEVRRIGKGPSVRYTSEKE